MSPVDSIQVLDHGYVRLVESWGSDERIIEAARMSTNKGFEGWGRPHLSTCPCSTKESFAACVCVDIPNGYLQGDEKLLRYLWTHKHTTPFEMAGLTIEVQAPIFVFREWHRHRTQPYNEMSARYTPLPDLNYIPSLERLMISGGANKQASSTGADLTTNNAMYFQTRLALSYGEAEATYQRALEAGVPKELARLCLPVGRYSRMRASANLWNWLHFLRLRMAPDAQWEIRQYANVVGDLISTLFPRTWSLFNVTGPVIK